MKGGFCLARFCQAAIQPLMKHHHAGGVSCFKKPDKYSSTAFIYLVWPVAFFLLWYCLCFIPLQSLSISFVRSQCELHIFLSHGSIYLYVAFLPTSIYIYIYLYIIYRWFSCLSIMSKWLFTVFDPLKRICIQIRYMYVWLHHYLSSFTW